MTPDRPFNASAVAGRSALFGDGQALPPILPIIGAGQRGDLTHGRRILFFDGGCRPNPGPMEIAVVSRGDLRFRELPGVGDNNEAEWSALLYAVDLAVAAGLTDVLFVGDSAVVIEQARGRWRCRSPHLQPYLDRFRAAATAIPRVRLKQVPRTKNLAGIALARQGFR